MGSLLLILLLIVVSTITCLGIASHTREDQICKFHCETVHKQKPDRVVWENGACKCVYSYNQPQK